MKPEEVLPFDAALPHDVIDTTDAIRAGDLLPPAIPREEVQVVLVEAIEIEIGSSAYARGAIRLGAQPADLDEHRGDLPRRRHVKAEIGRVDQARLLRQRRNLGRNTRRVATRSVCVTRCEANDRVMGPGAQARVIVRESG